MALYKYHYIELDTKRSPRISLQNIVAGETGNRLWITVTNNGETIDMSEKEDGEYIYRVCLVIKSNLGVRRQDSATEDSGITFIDDNTGDHGKVNILLSKDSFTAGKNRARIEIYSKRVEEDDTLIVSAEWTFDVEGADEGDNVGLATPLLVQYEKLAESWAVGGTGVREGEDTHNAKYYAEMANEVAIPSGSITEQKLSNDLKLKVIKDYVTPEMFGAKGDGVTDDTTAFQSALDSGMPVVAVGNYKVSSISVLENDLEIKGEILGHVTIHKSSCVSGGTIRATTDSPCVTFIQDANTSTGNMLNASLSNCQLVPTQNGVGIALRAVASPLFNILVDNVDIGSCDKSIYLYNERWITKCVISRVFCHTPSHVIYIDNQAVTNTYCGDIVFRDVFAQYYSNKPLDFVKLAYGNANLVLQDSFCYDGIKNYHFQLVNDGSTNKTSTITMVGAVHTDPAGAKFTDEVDLRNFRFDSAYSDNPTYNRVSKKTELPIDKYGSAYFEEFSASPISRFAGFVMRAGRNSGASAPNKVYGLSIYDGRVAVMRSTDGTITSGSYYELSTPYSGAVYTTATLPSSPRNGAKCWCSDIKMDVTYHESKWYKPDGTELTL